MKPWPIYSLLIVAFSAFHCFAQDQGSVSEQSVDESNVTQDNKPADPIDDQDQQIHQTIETLTGLVRESNDKEFRLRVVKLLANIPVDSVELLRFLVELTDDAHEEVAEEARNGVLRFNPVGEETSAFVLDWLKSNDEKQTAFAVSILTRKPGHLEDELIQLIDKGMINAEIRDSIFKVFSSWGNLKEPSLATLTRIYKDREELRVPILNVAKSLQKNGLNSLDLLNHAVKSDDKEIRELALSAIEKVLAPTVIDSRLQGMISSLMLRYDKNGDGIITKDEDDRGRFLEQMDSNGDGEVTQLEIAEKYGPALNRTDRTIQVVPQPRR